MSQEQAIMVNFGNNSQEELKEEDELNSERKRYFVSEKAFIETKDNHFEIYIFGPSEKSDNYEAQFSKPPLFFNTHSPQINTGKEKKRKKKN